MLIAHIPRSPFFYSRMTPNLKHRKIYNALYEKEVIRMFRFREIDERERLEKETLYYQGTESNKEECISVSDADQILEIANSMVFGA